MAYQKESAYQNAAGQCAGEVLGVAANRFVGGVLADLKAKVEQLRRQSQENAEGAELMTRKYNRAVEDAKKQKEKFNKKLENRDATIAELKANLRE